MDVHAAVVRSFGQPPRYEPFDLPAPSGGDQVLVDVLAVGLHPRVRTGAAGRHYTSTGKLPMVQSRSFMKRPGGTRMTPSRSTSARPAKR